MNKLKISLSLVVITFILSLSQKAIASDSAYAWVFFKSKDCSSFNPAEYFHPEALERRISLGLEPFDYLDIPVKSSYLEVLSDYCREVVGTSNWLNAALVEADNRQLNYISQLSFVSSVEIEISGKTYLAEEPLKDSESGPAGELLKQLDLHEYPLLKGEKLDGKGITIAVFDGGFPGVDTHPAFRHLHDGKRIKATWDFAEKTIDVYRHNNHGTAVLSCICGIKDSLPAGMATGANFLLARTELRGEPLKEELYWIQAAEWADKMGAEIISSSLGYTYHRYFRSDMTGKASLVARAANIAARKGMLVINCMGNEGNKNWKYAVTPADADSVLSVGGVEPESGLHIDFSSLGPNLAGETKPNVVASGKALAASPDGWKTVYGTSFSAPLVTGFAACAWQLYPKLDNMEIFNLIERSSQLYPYYDFAHGYGIPKASRLLLAGEEQTGQEIEGIRTTVSPGSVEIDVSKLLQGSSHSENYLYYNFKNAKGDIIRYGVYLLEGTEPLKLTYEESEGIEYCYLRTKNNYQLVELK